MYGLLLAPAVVMGLPLQAQSAPSVASVPPSLPASSPHANQSSPEALWQAGRDAQIAGNWDEAIEKFSQLLAASPQNLDAMVALGFSYFKRGDLTEAENLYRRALAVNNRQVGAGFGWGQVEMARKDWNKAATLFRDILRVAPDFQPVAARHNLALSLFALKRYDEAEEVYQEIIDGFAGSASPDLFTGALDNEIALEHYRRAAMWGGIGTKLHPEAAALWDRLAWALQRIGEPLLSDEAYRRAENLAYPDITPRNSTVFSLPFRGAWRVIQGNNGRDTHRGLGARFAWDFQALSAPNNTPTNNHEESHNGDRWRHNNNDFASFGQDILAPAPGRIVAVGDGTPDNDPFHPNPSPYSGNYILIEHAPDEFSSLGHLQNGSIKVKVGDIVERGQVIARCGNSGNTALPHLHFSFIGLYKGTRISMPSQFSNFRVVDIRRPTDADGKPTPPPEAAVTGIPTPDVPYTVEQGVPQEEWVVENGPEKPAATSAIPTVR